MKKQIGLLASSGIAWVLCACGPSKPAAEPTLPTPTATSPAATDSTATAPSKAAPNPSSVGSTSSKTKTGVGVPIFRNVPSWRRKIDFEDALRQAKVAFEVQPSVAMANTDMADKSLVIIPGAQWDGRYYAHYMENKARFDEYVKNGGVMLFELNGAEDSDITLPADVTMSKHGSRDNTILIRDHPIMKVFPEPTIHANFASHGFLENVPAEAAVLVTELGIDDLPDDDKPTFVEYSFGTGRVLAACQCFHDQDGSGRLPLMQSSIAYAAARKWFEKK